MTETPSSQAAAPGAPGAPGADLLLRGTTVAPGLVFGPVHLKDYELSRASMKRVPQAEVAQELGRFHAALLSAREQLADLKRSLAKQVPEHQARILDTHVAYLRDSAFISDVENLILNEQLTLEAAIGKVISDFDRIFQLVQSDTLRERAVDLRDVGIRVLRQLERPEAGGAPASTPPKDYILVARELSIVDMFNLQGQHVLGILTEEGGLTSHAAILARSMRIPTLTGVEGLLASVREGDQVIVDAAEGLVRVNPEPRVLEQYRAAKQGAEAAPARTLPSGAMEEPRTLDGEFVGVVANCGSLPEMEQAVGLGLPGGLYRTELMYMVDKGQPSVDVLLKHYEALLQAAAGHPLTFRLLHAEYSMGLAYLYSRREANPALGCAGVRALLSHEQVLRRQLQAILRASSEARLAVPFVTDCGDLRRVREILSEERFGLSKQGVPHAEQVEIGVVVETPAAVLGARALAREADFLIIGLDALVQHLLAADRENHALSGYFRNLHPFVLRALADLVEVCVEAQKPLSVFGYTAVQPHNTAFLLGVGLREFCVAPGQLGDFLAGLGAIDLRDAERAAGSALKSACQAETSSLVEGFRHGYARPK